MRPIRPLFEPLESRTLLSAAPVLASGLVHRGHAGPQSPIGGLVSPDAGSALNKRGIGHNVTMQAGVSSSVEVAFLPSPVLDPPGSYSASITWGDGTTSTATLQYATENGKGGYQIIGTHTYAAQGTYKISTVVTEAFNINLGAASATPIILVARINSKATVTPGSVDSGITLHETAGQSFTASVGTFVAIVPAKGFKASINWGDGTTSAGTLTAASVGLDTITYEVDGTHTYSQPGTYNIVTTVTRPAASTAAATPYRLIGATAVVTSAQPLSLAGTLSGTYKLALVPVVADVGNTYQLTGSGTAGDLGNVTVSGTVMTSGFILPATEHGSITLTNNSGSLTLTLGVTVTPLTGTAVTMNYQVSAGTGAYANASASGTATLTLTPAATTAGTNTFLLNLT